VLEGLAITELPSLSRTQIFRMAALTDTSRWQLPEGGLYFVTPTLAHAPPRSQPWLIS